MSRTNNLLPGIVECVLCCTSVEMVNGLNRREGTVMEAQNAREEFCHGSHGCDGDGYGAPDSVCGTTLR